MDQSRSTPTSIEDTSAPPKDTRVDAKGNTSVTWGITIISSMSLILTLLGYGVSLAVETIFGMPHETVYSSVLDLIGLSAYGVISLLLGLGNITWQPLLGQVWLTSLVGAVGTFFLVCCLVYLRARQAQVRVRTKGFWRYFGRPTEHDSTGQLLGKGAIGSGLIGAAIIVSPFLMVGVLVVTIVLISIVPMFGMQLGGHYFRKFVVTPTACEPVKSRTALLQAWSTPQKKNASTLATATCVALLKDGTRVASGRVVVSTPTAIVLFEPVSGSVRRVPIGDLTVLPTDIVQTVSQP